MEHRIAYLGVAFFFVMGLICMITGSISVSGGSAEMGTVGLVWGGLGMLWCVTGACAGILASWLRHCLQRITALEARFAAAAEETPADDPT